MRWVGLFRVGVWLLTLLGVYGLLRDARRGGTLPGTAAFTGQLLLSWGLFNFVEGISDHHLFGLHHVRDLPAQAPLYNWLFRSIGGLGLIALGWRLSRTAL